MASGDADEPLNVYRVVPVAPPSDRRWDDASGNGEVVVAVRTPGDARLVAAGSELDFMENDAAPVEDVAWAAATALRSGRRSAMRKLLVGPFTCPALQSESGPPGRATSDV